MNVGDFFDFNSELNCNLKLSTIEEILFEQIKSNYDIEKSVNKMKFEEMKEMTFEEFITTKKFEEELRKLKEIIRKFSKINFIKLRM